MEYLGWGGLTSIVSFIVVFLALVILIFIIIAISKMARSLDKATDNKEKKKSVAKAAPAPANGVTVEAPHLAPTPAPAGDDMELIAVLSAAAAACMGTSAGNVAVRSFRKVGESSWRRAGKIEQMQRV